MTVYQQMAVKNKCYITGRKIIPCGVMVHSTGANNPNLKRYVQPDDGRLGLNPYGNSFNEYQPGGRNVCPHAVIGKLADGSVASYQILPWDIEGWHAGGAANGLGYIGFEICEDGLDDAEYFAAVYDEAVSLTAYLCGLYGFDPQGRTVQGYPTVLCHSEGAALGIASNHGDVTHWFPRFGKTMDNFRADVAARMEGENVNNPIYVNRDDVKEEAPWGLATFDKLVKKGYLEGEAEGVYNISREMLRILVILDRAGQFD